MVERRQLGRGQPAAEGITTGAANGRLVAFVVFASLQLAASASAQTADAGAPKVTATLVNETRVESWSFFEPDPEKVTARPLGDPDYTFAGNRAELAVRVDTRLFDLTGAFKYVRLENLPADAIGPGALGTGALYYAASGLPYSYQLYLSELAIAFKTAGRRTVLTIGRQPYTSGAEAPSTSPSFEALKRNRLQSRLIGLFEFSLYQRRFDGVRLDVDRPKWHATAAAFLPTQGGFEESTNLTMTKIQVAGGAYTRRPSAATEWQAFGYLYRDRRDSKAVVDNTESIDKPVDITVAAFGGSYVRVKTVGSGEIDTVAWGAFETGDWYGQAHRAASVAAEAGYRWNEIVARPWLRGGYLWASGDDDPADDRHGTFFQMIPTSRKYALSTAYAQMNLRDAFVQAAVEPRWFRARLEVHRLDLASPEDLWYQGSGATSSYDRYFGFSGRASGGHASLGTIVEGVADVPIVKHWSINGYAGSMSAGEAVRHMFTDKRLLFWYIENVIRF